ILIHYWPVAASSLAWQDSATDIRIFPFERAGGFGIDAYIAQQLAREILDGSKDSARDHFALQPGEPDLDLIEPGGIRRCEMKPHVGVPPEKLFDLVGFVRGQVIEDDVNFLARIAARDY